MNKDQLRADVIDAARDLVEADRRNGGHRSHNEGGRGFSWAKVPLEEFKALGAKLKALDAPTPVKPSEVEPGTRFRFADEGQMPCRAYEEGSREFMMYEPRRGETIAAPVGQFWVFPVSPRVLLIPIEGEEE